MALLAFLHRRGFFGLPLDSELRPCLGRYDAGFLVLAETAPKEGWGGWAFEGKIVGLGPRQRLLARFPGNFPIQDARPGEYLFLSGKLERPRGPRNPGSFDVRGFLSDRGIQFILTTFSISGMGMRPGLGWTLENWAAAMRMSMRESFRRFLSPLDAGLLSGMTLGLKGRLPRKLRRAIQDAGVMHLIVPSGTKVALVLIGIWSLCYAASLGPVWRLIFCMALGGFYALAAGGDPPYLRALGAALFLEGGVRLGRDVDPFQALVLSAWTALIVDPLTLFSMGFQMSYAATFGLIVAMPAFERLWPRTWPPWIRYACRMGLATAIVEILLWPIFALGFGRAPFLGATANIILFPLAAFFMFGGFLLWVLNLAPCLPLALAVAWSLQKGLFIFCVICRFFSALPYAALELSHWSGVGVLAYYLAAGAFLLIPRFRASAILAFLAALLWASHRCLILTQQPELSVLYLSLPRGEAAIVKERGKPPFLAVKDAPAGVVAGVLRAEGIGALGKIVVGGDDSKGSRLVKAIGSRVSISSVVKGERVLRICRSRVCFGFDPPIVQRDSRKFDIISSLRRHAVEVSTNGNWVRIKNK